MDVYYNKDVLVNKENKTPTAKEIRSATLKTRIEREVAKQKERQKRIEAKARKMKQAMEK